MATVDAGRGEAAVLDEQRQLADGGRHAHRPGTAASRDVAARIDERRAERSEQLNVALADVEENCFDSLLFDNFAVHERHAVLALVKRKRCVEVFDCDANVIDCFKHESENTRAPKPEAVRYCRGGV